jgi:small subunit ribosomal protein S3e
MERTKTRSTKKKFVADGVFRAEINELLMQALAEFGFAGIEVNFTKSATEVRVLVSKFNDLMDQSKLSGIKIKELRGLIEQRFGFDKDPNHTFKLLAKKTTHGGLSAHEQAEFLKKKLLLGIPVRSAAMNVIRQMLQKGAKGCEVIVSGKLRQQRAKSMKFRDGYMIHSGQPRISYMDTAVRHIGLRQGIIGVKVRIMLPYNPRAAQGKGFGIAKPLPDVITFIEEKRKEETEQGSYGQQRDYNQGNQQ